MSVTWPAFRNISVCITALCFGFAVGALGWAGLLVFFFLAVFIGGLVLLYSAFSTKKLSRWERLKILAVFAVAVVGWAAGAYVIVGPEGMPLV